MTTMAAATSRIASTVDLDAPGLRHGYLKLPHSTHDSAYGWIPIPVTVAVGGSGPSVLLVAGNHGDEYEGQIALMKFVRALDVAALQGRLIALTAANFPAVMAGRRVSPIDGGNLNRAFPGNASGTPTEMIAHYIESVLLPRCQYCLDLHSGGSSLEYVPHVHARQPDDEERRAMTLKLIAAFGAPYGGLVRPLQGEPRTLSAAAERLGVIYLNAELGGGGTISHELVTMAEAGVRRALAATGVLPAHPSTPPARTMRPFSVEGTANYVYCLEDGLFEPFVRLCDDVQPGQPAGALHFPDTPWRREEIVRFESAGMVLCRRFPGWARRGDCLYQLASLVT
ncbi:MAG: succinylglutamate desuccinylase/aspartoacylase family protein [Reyranella sp.]|uniref:succinylglutamate desuccinylase/aspartoacylase family protein n=1 Tax=Reyranella sp. TaxID=1929291 RepID=UPI003D0FE0DA